MASSTASSAASSTSLDAVAAAVMPASSPGTTVSISIEKMGPLTSLPLAAAATPEVAAPLAKPSARPDTTMRTGVAVRLISSCRWCQASCAWARWRAHSASASCTAAIFCSRPFTAARPRAD